MRAIAITLVVIGHIPSSEINPDIHKWIYSFHIPLFFFISGITLSFTNYRKNSLKTILKKRFCHIYIPYLIWAILLSLPNISLLSIPRILYGTHQSIATVSNSSLWFLPVLFLSTILLDTIIFFFTIKHNYTSKLPIILPILLIIALLIPSQATIQEILSGHNLPFGLDIVPMAATFMLSGYLTKSFILRYNFSPYLLRAIAPITITLITFFGLNNNTSYVLMAENRYGNFCYFFVAAISGITISSIASFFISRYTKNLSKLMQKIGENTLIIFILQRYTLALTNEAITSIPAFHIPNIMIIPINIFITIPTCLIISIFVKKYTPILVGNMTKPTS